MRRCPLPAGAVSRFHPRQFASQSPQCEPALARGRPRHGRPPPPLLAGCGSTAEQRPPHPHRPPRPPRSSVRRERPPAVRRRVPGHRHRGQRAGHHQLRAAADRVAVADGHRDPLRDRRRAAGRRRRRQLHLPGAARRGPSSRRSSRTPRRSRSTRPTWCVVSNDANGLVAALHTLEIPVLVQPAVRPSTTATRRRSPLGQATGHGAGRDGGARMQGQDRRRRRVGAGVQPGLKVYHELSGPTTRRPVRTFIGSIYAPVRAARTSPTRRRRPLVRRLSAAVCGVHRHAGARADRAGRHAVLRRQTAAVGRPSGLASRASPRSGRTRVIAWATTSPRAGARGWPSSSRRSRKGWSRRLSGRRHVARSNRDGDGVRRPWRAARAAALLLLAVLVAA